MSNPAEAYASMIYSRIAHRKFVREQQLLKNGIEKGIWRDDEGYDADGYDEHGYDRHGADRLGLDRNGNVVPYIDPYIEEDDLYQKEMMEPLERQNQIIRNINEKGIARDDEGYDWDGYDKDGFDRNGVNQYGLDRDGNWKSPDLFLYPPPWKK